MFLYLRPTIFDVNSDRHSPSSRAHVSRTVSLSTFITSIDLVVSDVRRLVLHTDNNVHPMASQNGLDTRKDGSTLPGEHRAETIPRRT